APSSPQHRPLLLSRPRCPLQWGLLLHGPPSSPLGVQGLGRSLQLLPLLRAGPALLLLLGRFPQLLLPSWLLNDPDRGPYRLRLGICEAASGAQAPEVSILLPIDHNRRQQSPGAQLVEKLTRTEQGQLVLTGGHCRADVKRYRLAVTAERIRLLALRPDI